jgi:hypothetical protein
MAEASQDSRPSDGKRGATPNARRYPRTDPAKFTHIADRWPRRCAQGRRGGAASNGGRLAMKRATSSPLAKDAASLSIFAEIARLIAGPDTPQWLATHFKRWASSLMLDRFVESALQEAAMGKSSDPHLESGARLQKAEARWWPVRHGRFTYAGRREEVPGGWSAGPKAATVNGRRSAREREGGRHCRHRRPDFCAHCRLSMSMTKPNKVVERACISHIARDRVATSKSR